MNEAKVVSVEKFTSAGPGLWYFVHHPVGFLIDVGWHQEKAEQIAAEINAGRVALSCQEHK